MSSKWLSFPELRRIAGDAEAVALCRSAGGVSVYVPKKPEMRPAWAKALSAEAWASLAAEYGGDVIAFPNLRRSESFKADIVRMLADGKTCREIAKALPVTERYVRSLMRRVKSS